MFMAALAAIAGLSYLLLTNTDYNDPNIDGLARGEAAFTQGDFDEAAAWFHQAAKLDNQQAQYRYAMLYRDGSGVQRDDRQAVAWLKLAAAQGHLQAQYELAKLLESGRGMDAADPASAAGWYRKAAEKDLAAAQLRLAMLYADGRGVKKSEATALDWAIKAAKTNNTDAESFRQQLLNRVTAKAARGDAKAQFILARLYQRGEGINADVKSAEQWLRASAASGNAEAQFHLANLLVKQPAQISEAAGWYLSAARQKHVLAASAIGTMSATGLGTAQNSADALHWLRLAAEAGIAEAQTNLGIVYGEADGFSHD
ncbi:MAG: hypothetical protein CO187_01095, partial [Zetaproteobacteria bacterium CG_4_9_14_3_um_filter_53_7]